MKIKLIYTLYIATAISSYVKAQELLVYHPIRTDEQGQIIPWYHPEPGIAYDQVMRLTWEFWKNMRRDDNGLPYYMNHQVWKAGVNDPRGLGGDQLQMALSAWRLYYAYTGDEAVKDNMKFMADYYLGHSLSPDTALWPHLPFPYNTLVYSGQYDGDMVLGKDYTQPDKAASFGLELVYLYKMTQGDFFFQTTSSRYLEAAIKIAHTLVRHIQPGDADHSPWPFKVNVYTGSVGVLYNNYNEKKVTGYSSYTTNYAPALELFLELELLDPEYAQHYRKAFNTLLQWMIKYPMQTQKWGPFFEDVYDWSDTQINATTFVDFILQHRDLFPSWSTDSKRIIDWVYTKLGNDEWKKYGVTVINEQTFYQVPAHSHTARQGAVELKLALLTADTFRLKHAIRQLHWSTYMVDEDGKSYFPLTDVWLTDGYGDFVRHFLRAMPVYPALAPPGSDHLLGSTSVIQQADYAGQWHKLAVSYLTKEDQKKLVMSYRTYDAQGQEVLRLQQKPSAVWLDGAILKEDNKQGSSGYSWEPLTSGGICRIRRHQGQLVAIVQ